MARVIAYIDGFNLYHGLRAKYRHRYLWLNLEHLIQRLRPNDEIVLIRYFTALVLDDDPAILRQQNYLNALKAHSGAKIDIVLGRYTRSDFVCQNCGHQRIKYEEKETDVNIAVSIVADTAAQTSDIALVVSADSDLCPAIRMARSLGTRRGMIAVFPPARSSFEVRSLIRGAFTLPAEHIRNSLLPDDVVDPVSGRSYRRPVKWR
ncbi:NYN domain-containing protein [Kutzneria sp. NPDC052558]|uniref:NYN domain-containing protein n=1 Tax=Kutzneria sp. NPDC052558 TaxID=3364121 RepID=UPI0037CCB14E